MPHCTTATCSGHRLVCDGGGGGGEAGEQDAAWAYAFDRLLPIHMVWQTDMTYRRALRRYAAELAVNAAAMAGREEAPPALTFNKFDESLRSLFGLFHTFVPEHEKRRAFDALAVVMPSADRYDGSKAAAAHLPRDQFPAAVVRPDTNRPI